MLYGMDQNIGSQHMANLNNIGMIPNMFCKCLQPQCFDAVIYGFFFVLTDRV